MQQKEAIWIHRESDGQRLRSLLVKLMLSLGANNYNQTMAYAARGGHMDIVKLMLSPSDFDPSREGSKSRRKGANDYNFAMEEAAEKGHMEIVELMLSLGANDYNEAMGNAARFGHREIVKLLKTYM